MAIRPSTPEIITVNSEALQTQIRDLLPSQNGFGSELQATNVITPIIDLTAAAEGSALPSFLQTALAFGSQTHFDATNSTVTIANSPGFYRVVGSAGVSNAPILGAAGELQMSDGLSTKTIWAARLTGTSTDQGAIVSFDLVFWLDVGITLQANATSDTNIQGSSRQIADSTGALVQPSGFPL